MTPAEYVVSVNEAYKRLFSTDDGTTVLKDLMHAHYVTCPLPLREKEYGEGARNVVLRILALAEIDITKAL